MAENKRDSMGLFHPTYRSYFTPVTTGRGPPCCCDYFSSLTKPPVSPVCFWVPKAMNKLIGEVEPDGLVFCVSKPLKGGCQRIVLRQNHHISGQISSRPHMTWAPQNVAFRNGRSPYFRVI